MSELYEIKGCSSHSCQIEPPKGIGTNGSCNCIRDIVKVQQIIHNNKQLRSQLSSERCEDDSICEDDDGCPTENARLRREWRELRSQLAEAREKLSEANGAKFAAEAYQIIGAISFEADLFENESVQNALTYFSDAASGQKVGDILPFFITKQPSEGE